MNGVNYKSEIRLLGWDDASFDADSNEPVPIIGTVTRGGKPYVDGFIFNSIQKDGFDCTEKMISSIKNSKHKDQLKAVMLDGITFAGFNTVDIAKLSEETGLPVIAVTRKDTDLKKFKEAMKNTEDFKRRWGMVEKAGEFKSFVKGGNEIYFQCAGIKHDDAKEIIKVSISRSFIPEPIRISHLVASAIVKGESIAGA